MAYKTVRQLIDDTLKALSMGSGSGVQIYADDRIRSHLYQAYEYLVDKYFWYSLASYENYTLDGSTGQVTGDISNKIISFNDIYQVFRGNDTFSLPKLGMNLNRNNIRRHSIVPNPNPMKVFTVYPVETSGAITVHHLVRSLEEQWLIDDFIVLFDPNVLVYRAAWEFMTDDGTNPASESKYAGKYKERLQILRSREIGPIIATDRNSGRIPLNGEWTI